MSAGGVVIVPSTADLEQSQLTVYNRPIGLRLLYQDPESGEEHYLVRYPAGMEAQRHWHTAAHTIVVLEGTLVVNGEDVGAGTYCHFPAREPMHHAPGGDTPCLFINIFHGAADVFPVDQAGSEVGKKLD